MRILNFKAKNIFSLGEVELDLDKRSLLLVTGHSNDEGGANGSGKSSLSSKGIVWTLYGSTAAGDKADAVINRFAGEDTTCSGILDVECNNGSKFRIIRSRRPNKLTILDLLSNEDISCKLEKDTQALIDKLLGRSRETFLQTDFFGQGKAANFLDLTPKAQVELLETILPFDQINELADVTKLNLARMATLTASVNKHIAEASGKMLEAQNSERQLSASVDNWEKKQEITITKIKAEIVHEESTDKVKAAIELLKEEVASIPTRQEATQRFKTFLDKEIEYIESISDYNEAITLWRVAKDDIPRAPKPPVSPNCPTCKAPTSQSVYDDLVLHYAEMNTKLDECDLNISHISTTIKDMNHTLQNYQTQKNECQRILTRHDQIEVKIVTLEADRATNKLAILKESLAKIEADINPYVLLYEQSTSNVRTLMSSLSFHKQRFEKIDQDTDALEFWQTAFNKDLKNEFIKQVCPFLQERAIIHLEGMGNGQLKIQVNTTKTLKSNEDRSEFTISVASTTGGATYDALSGGEKQMVNFAFGLALADLAELQVEGHSYITILDEPMFALDERNSENFVNYLQSFLLTKKETILLVSNEESLKRLIPNQIKVIKQNGITSLETI